MGYRWDDLAPGEFYHVCTRGVEKRDVFLSKADHKRFLTLLRHCLPQGQVRSLSLMQEVDYQPKLTRAGDGLVDLTVFCLMTNHIHLLLRENVEGGISLYMKRVLTSYACYFNRKHQRSGSLFLHPFKAVLVNDDDQLLHVSRYIHLNPVMARMTDEIADYPWSSIGQYIQERPEDNECHVDLIRSMMKPAEYRKFVKNEADYERSMNGLDERLLIDNDHEKRFSG